jgi:RNA polymerase sigma-70 factor (ECF subfamily)
VDSTQPAAGNSPFAATRWTLVLRARGGSAESRVALGELCEAYYAPVLEFIRAAVRDEDQARDLTQGFFARVLQGGAFDRAEPERGRFRSFLLGAVKHFLSDIRDRDCAQKRGGGVEVFSLEPGSDTSPGFDAPDPQAAVSDATFDRQWAFTLLDRALRQLGAELAAAGKADHFDALKPWLTGAAATPQSEAAARLGLSESAVKVAIHRLRTRFRELVKAEIAQTVSEPAEVAGELNYLVEVLAQG